MTNRGKDKLKDYPTDSVFVKSVGRIGAVLIVISIIISGFYLYYSWNKYEDRAYYESVTLAKSMGTLLRPDNIAELSGTTGDLENPEYTNTKSSLLQMVQTTDEIEVAYLMGVRGGSLVILANSAYPDSPAYSTPGQVYEEAEDVVLEVLRTGEADMKGPITDRWGTGFNALVPVKDPASGQTIAVFGLKFSDYKWRLFLWNQMFPDMVITVLFVLFMVALSSAAYHYYKLKALSERESMEKALYHSVFEQAPAGIAIVNDKRFVSHSKFGTENMNPMFEEVLGRTSEELADINWLDITHPDDLAADLDNFEQFKAGKIDGYSMRKRFLKPDGTYVWTNMKITHFLDRLRDNPMHLCLLYDITAEKETEDSLRESERSKSVLLSNLPGMAYRCSHDPL